MLTDNYRPKSLEEFTGLVDTRATIGKLLTRAVEDKGKNGMALLFTGKGGTGKTSMAFAIANTLGVNRSWDFWEKPGNVFRFITTDLDWQRDLTGPSPLRSRFLTLEFLPPTEEEAVDWLKAIAHAESGDGELLDYKGIYGRAGGNIRAMLMELEKLLYGSPSMTLKITLNIDDTAISKRERGCFSGGARLLRELGRIIEDDVVLRENSLAVGYRANVKNADGKIVCIAEIVAGTEGVSAEERAALLVK